MFNFRLKYRQHRYFTGFLTTILLIMDIVQPGTAQTIKAKPMKLTGSHSDNSNYAVHFISYHDFPYQKKWRHEHIQGCFRLKSPGGRNYLRCKEQTNLIRSKKQLDIFLNEQKQTGHVNLHTPDNERAYIISITESGQKRTTENTDNMLSVLKTSALKTSVSNTFVSGTFMHHVMAVKKYTFKTATGNREKITVTPQHRFYVLNKRQFIPIKNITPTDRLITSSGKTASLIHTECYPEKSCKSDRPIAVYNIETNRKHTYFAGKNRILVHNGCSRLAGAVHTFKRMLSNRSYSNSRELVAHKFHHKIMTNDEIGRITVVSKYIDTSRDGNTIQAKAITDFMEHKIVIWEVYKDPEFNFFASDIVKHQFHLAHDNYFLPFNINRATQLIAPRIMDAHTLNLLKFYKTGTPEFTAAALTTPWGKFINHLTTDLYWEITSIDYRPPVTGIARSLRFLLRETEPLMR